MNKLSSGSGIRTHYFLLHEASSLRDPPLVSTQPSNQSMLCLSFLCTSIKVHLLPRALVRDSSVMFCIYIFAFDSRACLIAILSFPFLITSKWALQNLPRQKGNSSVYPSNQGQLAWLDNLFPKEQSVSRALSIRFELISDVILLAGNLQYQASTERSALLWLVNRYFFSPN